MSQSSSPNSDKNSAVVINQDGKVEYHIADDNGSELQDNRRLKDVSPALNNNEVAPVGTTNKIIRLIEQFRNSRIIL